jgi:hypothetical protein
MVSDSLAFETANWHVDHFVATAARSQVELNRDDCDVFLRMGIEAFDWLCQVDSEFHRRLYTEPAAPNSDSTTERLQALFRRWLEKRDVAEALIARVERHGLQLENLARYRECCRSAAAIVKHFETDFSQDAELPVPMATLMDEAVQEHLDGKTAEFI